MTFSFRPSIIFVQLSSDLYNRFSLLKFLDQAIDYVTNHRNFTMLIAGIWIVVSFMDFTDRHDSQMIKRNITNKFLHKLVVG